MKRGDNLIKLWGAGMAAGAVVATGWFGTEALHNKMVADAKLERCLDKQMAMGADRIDANRFCRAKPVITAPIKPEELNKCQLGEKDLTC